MRIDYHKKNVRECISNESGAALLVVALVIFTLALVGSSFMGTSIFSSWNSSYALLNQSANRNLASNAAAAWAMKLDTAVRNGTSLAAFQCSLAGSAAVVDPNDANLSYTCQNLPSGSTDTTKQNYLIVASEKSGGMTTKSSFILKSRSSGIPVSGKCNSNFPNMASPSGFDVYTSDDFSAAVANAPVGVVTFPRSVMVTGKSTGYTYLNFHSRDVVINGDLMATAVKLDIDTFHTLTVHGNANLYTACEAYIDGRGAGAPSTLNVDGNLNNTGGNFFSLGVNGAGGNSQTITFNVGGDVSAWYISVGSNGGGNTITANVRDMIGQDTFMIGSNGASSNVITTKARNISASRYTAAFLTATGTGNSITVNTTTMKQNGVSVSGGTSTNSAGTVSVNLNKAWP